MDDVLNNREDKLPEIGKYNAGQKLLFFVLIASMCGLLLSGIVIWRAYFASTSRSTWCAGGAAACVRRLC
jgi:formate dehydrogenase subunit gamma